LTLLAGGLLAVLGQADKHGVGGEECLLSKYLPCSMRPWLSSINLGIGMASVRGGDGLGGWIICCGMIWACVK
jgi:hypothetical protein